MPLFISDEELRFLDGDTTAVAELADAAIRELRREVDTVRVETDAAAIAADRDVGGAGCGQPQTHKACHNQFVACSWLSASLFMWVKIHHGCCETTY